MLYAQFGITLLLLQLDSAMKMNFLEIGEGATVGGRHADEDSIGEKYAMRQNGIKDGKADVISVGGVANDLAPGKQATSISVIEGFGGEGAWGDNSTSTT